MYHLVQYLPPSPVSVARVWELPPLHTTVEINDDPTIRPAASFDTDKWGIRRMPGSWVDPPWTVGGNWVCPLLEVTEEVVNLVKSVEKGPRVRP